MKLKDILNHIDSDLEFELYKGERIGIFKITDKGVNQYLEEEIIIFEVRNNRLMIDLVY
jgi:hypothetical protein